MLKKLLTTDVIQVIPKVKDWRQAVALACQPLLDNGAIQPTYVDAIYRAHDTLGPYYVIGPGIAMPHARPEEGVNRMALALLIITEGVYFQAQEHDPVRLLVVLAAQDSHSHIEAIAQLAALFDNSADVAALCAARDRHTILRVIERY